MTGASGFVGACLARRLLQEGHDVHALVRPTHQAWRLDEVRQDVVLHAANLEDEDSVTRCLRQVRPEWVFHLAACGAYSHQTEARQIFRTNVLGTVNLVCAALAAGVEVFVNTGSSSEYGFKDHGPSEMEPVEPNSEYAVAKASATFFCQLTARKERRRIPTLRLYSVYGPYEEPSRLVPTLIVNGFQGRLPRLVDPNIARDFVFVEEVCGAYLAAAQIETNDPGPVYNVGSGRQTTIADAVAASRELFAIREEPHWGSYGNRKWDTTIWVADPRRIALELGWRATVGFREGLAATAQWLRDSPHRLRYESSVV